MLIISDLFIVLCALYCQADEGLVHVWDCGAVQAAVWLTDVFPELD